MSNLINFALALTRPAGSDVATLKALLPRGTSLVTAINTVAAAADRAGEFNSPVLFQGFDDMSTEYQCQPVVWDGSFSEDDNGQPIYSGYAGASGHGGYASRIIRDNDRIGLALIRATVDDLGL